MKVKDLNAARLDYWVAIAGKEWEFAHKHFPTMTLDPTFKGVELGMYPRGEYGTLVETCILLPNNEFRQERKPFCPSIWWNQGGELIERKRISLTDRGDHWFADMFGSSEIGSTPLIAAMRSLVASVFGDEVEDIK